MTFTSAPPAPTTAACAVRRTAAVAQRKIPAAIQCSLHGTLPGRACPRLVVYVPTHLPPSAQGEKPRRIDLETGSQARRFMAEAALFGVELDVDHALANQLGGGALGMEALR